MDFDFDSEKARLNPINHDGVTFEEASAVLLDPYALTRIGSDTTHEPRYITLGMGGTSRILMVVWTERTERIRSSVLKKLDENPELKKAYQTLVKNLPEDQQEKIMANIAMRTQRTVSRGQEQAAARPAQKV